MELAQALEGAPGEKVTLIAPQGLVTPAAVLPRRQAVHRGRGVRGRMFEFDSALRSSTCVTRRCCTAWRPGERRAPCWTNSSRRCAGATCGLTLGDVRVTDWTRSHANFFRAVALKKKMMAIILFLIVAVAGLQHRSTLAMAVQEKYADIAILRTLGGFAGIDHGDLRAAGNDHRLAGLPGTLGGMLLATNLDVVIPALEQVLSHHAGNKEIHYITEMPSRCCLPTSSRSPASRFA